MSRHIWGSVHLSSGVEIGFKLSIFVEKNVETTYLAFLSTDLESASKILLKRYTCLFSIRGLCSEIFAFEAYISCQGVKKTFQLLGCFDISSSIQCIQMITPTIQILNVPFLKADKKNETLISGVGIERWSFLFWY